MMVVVSVNLDRIFALMRTLLPVGAVQKIGHYLQQSTKATTARRYLKLGFDLDISCMVHLRPTSNGVGMSSLIFWFQAEELRLSVCCKTFRNFNGS